MFLSKSYLIELLKVNPNDITEEESLAEYNLTVSYGKDTLNITVIKSIISSVNERDNIFINEENSNDILKQDSSDEQIQEIVDEINSNLELGPVTILISVKKNKTDTLSIYNSEKFFSYLDKYNLFDFLKAFNQLIINEGILIFQTLNDDIKLITKTFAFSSETISFEYFDRDSYLNKANLIGKTNIDYALSLTPYDFKLFDYSNDINYLEKTIKRFKQLQYILSLRYISNESVFSTSTLEFYIFGYKNIQLEYVNNIENELIPNDNINEIFEWAFVEGNIVDKIGIVRNVLSINYNDDNFKSITDSEYDSIIGNYQLYLKKHVQEYLKLKETVTSKFQTFCDECSDQISQFSSTLRKNFLALFGYLITVLLTKGFVDKATSDIFSKDVTIITSFVLVGSFIVWVISIYYYYYQNKYVDEKIHKLKQYYRDIITEKELLRIINDNTLIDFTKEKNKHQVRALSIIWIVSLIVAFLVLDAISGSTKLLFFINIFK